MLSVGLSNFALGHTMSHVWHTHWLLLLSTWHKRRRGCGGWHATCELLRGRIVVALLGWHHIVRLRSTVVVLLGISIRLERSGMDRPLRYLRKGRAGAGVRRMGGTTMVCILGHIRDLHRDLLVKCLLERLRRVP